MLYNGIMSEKHEKDPSGMRVDYDKGELRRGGLPLEPLSLFKEWFAAAAGHDGVVEPNAMTLATADAEGAPSARTVLCKGWDDALGGIEFYTNYGSRKGREISVNPRGAAVFVWHVMQRQVCLRGRVERVSRERSAAYFHSRPYGSQIGALASDQSAVLVSRDALDERAEVLRAEFPEGECEVPLPEGWGGYVLVPEVWEFWQGRRSRLHDRFAYRAGAEAGEWLLERLNP